MAGGGGNGHNSIFRQHMESRLPYDPSQARTNENNQNSNWDNQVNGVQKSWTAPSLPIYSQLTSCPRTASAVGPMMQYWFNFIIFATHYENYLNILGRMHQMNIWHALDDNFVLVSQQLHGMLLKWLQRAYTVYHFAVSQNINLCNAHACSNKR